MTFGLHSWITTSMVLSEVIRSTSINPPNARPAPHCGGEVNIQVWECLVGLCQQRWRPLAEEPPRALREVERLTRNPEELANAGAGVGRAPYGERDPLRPTGLLTLPGEGWSPPGKRPRNSYMTNLDGQCQGGPEGETIENYQDW